MNKLSYEVSCRRFAHEGFVVSGSVRESVDDTIKLMGIAGGVCGGTGRNRE